jgi:hypothetical protein
MANNKVNTGKAETSLALTPSVERQRIIVKPNANTVIVERNKSVVPTVTTKEEIQYDDAGKPTGTLVTTTTIKDRTIPVERTVINKDGKVIKHAVQVKTGQNVKVTTALEPYSSPDYDVQIPITPVVTSNPTQPQQVISYPSVDDDGQIEPAVDSTGVTYVSVGSVASTANGAIIAQTWRAPRDGYVTSVEVKIKALGASGDLTGMVAGTRDTGEPDMSNVYSSKTAAFADLETGWMPVIVQPVFVRKGELYSTLLESTGAHTFECAIGGNYSQGTFFSCTDASWFRGLQDVDLGMRVKFAEFTETQITTTMEPLSLDGGIGAVMFRFFEILPEGTNRVIRGQIDNIWTDLASPNGAYPFANLPGQVLIQQVLSGTKDLMPVMNHDISRWTTYRKRSDFVGISEPLTMGATVTSASVTATLIGFDDTDHDCVIQLRKTDNSLITPSGYTDTPTDDANVIERTATFTFTGITEFRVQMDGETVVANSHYGASEIRYSAD